MPVSTAARAWARSSLPMIVEFLDIPMAEGASSHDE